MNHLLDPPNSGSLPVTTVLRAKKCGSEVPVCIYVADCTFLPKACVLRPEPPPLSCNTYLQKGKKESTCKEGKKREHMQAEGLELC